MNVLNDKYSELKELMRDNNNVAQVSSILDSLHVPDVLDSDEDSLLTVVAMRGNINYLRLLIQRGSDVCHRNKYGDTPLIASARAKDRNCDVIRELVQAGARVNECGPGGTTALIEASSHNFIENAKVLLELGADPNFKNVHEESALSYSIVWGYSELAQLLIVSGVDMNWIGTREKRGWTYERLAEYEQRVEILNAIRVNKNK